MARVTRLDLAASGATGSGSKTVSLIFFEPNLLLFAFVILNDFSQHFVELLRTGQKRRMAISIDFIRNVIAMILFYFLFAAKVL